jgi:TonB family protein
MAATAPAETPAPTPATLAAATPAMPVALLATAQPLDLPGAMTSLSAPGALASGGGGSQPGRGAGDGKGDGVGPGSEKGTGGGEYQAGDGNATIPQLIFEKRPTYTSEATLARIQGVVELEVVVLADGTVGRPKVVHSLDPGLDRRAIEAVTQWRFKPGRRRDTNEAVSVIVRVQLTFTLR